MKPVATLGLYTAALGLVFGAAVGVGNAVGPVGTAGENTAAHGAATDEHRDPSDEHGAAEQAAADDLAPGGLAVSQDGYTLQLDSATHPAGASRTLTFTVSGPDGETLTDFTRTHDEDLHLIVVRRDLTGYQHLHPDRDGQGRWSIPLTLVQPGPYKVFADFTPAGSQTALTLAADLTAPGPYAPAPLPPPARTASVDGYDVTLDGELVAGTSSRLTLSVSRDGAPVTDLQPYLAAYGHLVALRAGDLAYLHVHPDGEVDDPATTSGPDITFYADVPSPATYRLFLDFSHDGAVRTAELTAVAAPPGSQVASGTAGHDGGADGH